MELGMIIVLALTGVYMTVLVAGSILQAREDRRKMRLVSEGGRTAA